jgi:molybdenum cofactor synthesis domain-containing protein
MDSKIKAGILTISDKGSQGKRTDESGPVAAEILQDDGFLIQEQAVVPDQRQDIIDTLRHWVDDLCLGLIITSGGTGLSPTDVTPQAMEGVVDYQVPGMAEAMRAESLKKTPHAMISRAMVGVRKSTLIINLPGSPGGVRDNLTTVLPALKHAISKLQGDTTDCAT